MRTVLAVLLAATAPFSAMGTVTYTFTALSGGLSETGSFAVTMPNFFIGPNNTFMYVQPNIPLASLDYCNGSLSGFASLPAQQLTCGAQTFSAHNTIFTGDNLPHDVVGFGFNAPYSTIGYNSPGYSTSYYYFEDGAFSEAGHYESSVLGLSQAGTLDVTVSDAPEPTTWALMLVGFGGIGYAMRRNREVPVSFS